jgi:hypothetical protein
MQILLTFSIHRLDGRKTRRTVLLRDKRSLPYSSKIMQGLNSATWNILRRRRPRILVINRIPKNLGVHQTDRFEAYARVDVRFNVVGVSESAPGLGFGGLDWKGQPSGSRSLQYQVGRTRH